MPICAKTSLHDSDRFFPRTGEGVFDRGQTNNISGALPKQPEATRDEPPIPDTRADNAMLPCWLISNLQPEDDSRISNHASTPTHRVSHSFADLHLPSVLSLRQYLVLLAFVSFLVHSLLDRSKRWAK